MLEAESGAQSLTPSRTLYMMRIKQHGIAGGPLLQ